MRKQRSIAWMFSAATMILGVKAAFGQDYPNKPIRIVTSNVGGGNDFVARLVAQGLTGPMGQAVIVENRPTALTGEIVAKAAPDGYTLLLAGATFIVGPLLQATPYDPMTDFLPITLAGRVPNILLVHPSVPAKSVKELIALARARPGELNYASTGGGGSNAHLSTELFNAMARIKTVHVPYQSAGPGLIALMSGEVQLMFTTASSAMPHVKSGRVRVLAVTSAQPSALVPGVPTVAASGLPGYEVVANNAIYAPAKTPAAVINRLNLEVVRVLQRADVKQKFFDSGVDPVASSPEELAATMKSELAKWGKVIKDAGIRVD